MRGCAVVKERPILFNSAMVRAILEGRKTVTRRPVKGLQIPNEDPSKGETRHRWSAVGQCHPRYGFCVFGETEEECAMELAEFGACPHGRPGDRLWVREAWQGPLVDDDEMRADPSWWKDMSPYQNTAHCSYRASGDSCEFTDPDGNMQCRWKPSIHMPRWASRILLEITAVRVERLHDISEDQAVAEGVERPENIRDVDVWDGAERELFNAMNQPRDRFKRLWADINGAESWDANPWVWVVEFKRVEAGR